MSTQSAFSFFLAIFIFGITPGPGVFAILARAMSHGTGACLSLALGMTLSDIAYLVLACLGLATLATHWSDVFALIRIVGGLYLCYLGYRLWVSPVSSISRSAPSAQSRGQGFLQGFLISASNPKVILFYIAFLPTFIDLQALTRTDIAIASALTFVALMSAMMLIAVSVSLLRQRLVTPEKMQGVNRAAGGVMIAAGLYLISRRPS